MKDIESITLVVTLVIAVLGFILAIVAYWRAGGKQDVKTLKEELRSDLEALRVTQREIIIATSNKMTQSMDESRHRLRESKDRLVLMKDEAIEGLEKQVKQAASQLHALEARLEKGVKTIKTSTAATAQLIQQGIAVRVHRMEAQTILLLAKVQTGRAAILTQKQKFGEAEERLEQAAELVRLAREKLEEDSAFDEQLDSIKEALQEATIALQNEAEEVRVLIESVLTETDRMVDWLESYDEKEEEMKAA